jgi:hypothetical protein
MPARDIPTSVANARKQAARSLAKQVHYAELNARIMRARANDPGDPLTEEIAVEHENLVGDQRRSATDVAKTQSTTLAKVMNEVAEEWRREVEQHLVVWRDERAIHQDLLDHPELYGGVMPDGQTPIVSEQEQAAIQALDAAIAEAERSLDAKGKAKSS